MTGLNKTEVYHFNNGRSGGVFSVIKNLVEYSDNNNINNHIIYTVNKDIVPVFTPEPIRRLASQQIFYYSPKWNFYYTCKKLAELLPDNEALIIAHDWLELGMASNLGLRNPLVQFVHGDYNYYYDLSQKHSAAVDRYVTVSENIKQNLIQRMPQRQNNISYCHLPVAEIVFSEELKKGKEQTDIIFIGRPEKAKGYHLLNEIAEGVQKKYRAITWHIVGGYKNKEQDEIKWNTNSDIRFYGQIRNKEVAALLQKMDMLILPSVAEGMPVVVIEAMKAGVIPIVNDIGGGIDEIITNGIRGYKIKDNAVKGFVEKIIELINDQLLLEKMQKQCVDYSNRYFDPFINTKKIEEIYLHTLNNQHKHKFPVKVYGSRLDAKWIPNLLVTQIRRLKDLFKN